MAELRLPLPPSLSGAVGDAERRALAEMCGEASGPLTTDAERRLAQLRSEVLKVPVRIGRAADFHRPGGTSLTTVRLAVALGRVVSGRRAGSWAADRRFRVAPAPRGCYC